MMRSRPKLRRLPATFVAGFGSLLFVAGVFAQQNLALHQPVASSGANWGSFKPAALTDGDPATFTHPAAASGTTDFYYEVDLGADRRLERIVLRNRQDGCCTERLSRIRVEVWSDAGGGAGRKAWSALVRGDGSDSGVGGTDTLLAELDPVGDFAGRFVRVVNTSGAPYNPQLAEIEVYGGSAP
ncbi:MAG: discoidin domain-containing protein, partial [Verrucomicrobiales bacterium]|nr:discoidin domain-containing protein [Verrucomicrobiales bacterium]